METLLSTVAQISFTLVGLFYLALTVDSSSRQFWFSEKLQSRYAYIHLLFLLMPGLVALSGLIPSPWESFPVWPLTNLFLVVFYWLLFRDLVKLKKELDFNKISLYEEQLDSIASTRANIRLLFLVSIIGLFAYAFFPNAITWANSFFGFALFLIVMVAIVPINVFMSVNIQNKIKTHMGKARSRKEKSVKKTNGKR